jgi:hypothetical protein
VHTHQDPVPDYYQVLGVNHHATQAEIRAAYRRAALRYHPDTNRDPAVGALMRAVNRAHDVLGDPDRRAAYDRQRLSASPPCPRLEPPAVDFGSLGPHHGERPVSVRVLNDGGTPATVRVEPEAGAFWMLVGVRGPSAPGEVAVLDLVPRRPQEGGGCLRSRLQVSLDDRPATLLLSAVTVGPAARHQRSPGPGPGARTPPPPPGRQRRAGRYLLLSAVVAGGVLAAWPGAPGASLASKLAGALTTTAPPPHGRGPLGATPPVTASPGAGGGASAVGPLRPHPRPHPMPPGPGALPGKGRLAPGPLPPGRPPGP